MKRSVTSWALGVVALSMLCPLFAMAQQARPYHDGPVWVIQFIRVKPGMDDRYMRWLASDWKQEQDAMKKAGYMLDYKVITTEPHGSQDWNVMLMTEFKDLTTMEANEDKAEALGQQIAGGQPKIESGYQERASYREPLAERMGREVILSPK